MEQTDIAQVVKKLRDTFNTGQTRPLAWRIEQLESLKVMILENETKITQAVYHDFGKSFHETWMTEIGFVLAEIDYALKHLNDWTRPDHVTTPLINQPGSSAIYHDPLGVVLIIGPWNYPFHLVIAPMIGAIAAGNCIVLKPSEISENTSELTAQLIDRYLDRNAIAVIQGGVLETTTLLEQRFDHIFYTGGPTVGQIVMSAAARHLTPVTLELGGKSPCIVDQDVDIKVAARRIIWGKLINAGQTCVAPDYMMVHESIADAVLEYMKEAIVEFYGPDPKKSQDYARIINTNHFNRLIRLLSQGDIVCGGTWDETSRYIEPTIISHVKPDFTIMQDEIFGPLLPVMTFEDLSFPIEFINSRPKPLALYLFSRNKQVHTRVLENTSSGGVCINDIIMHLTVPELPFGGVGGSGMGAYHGKFGFETFSHKKSVLKKSLHFDPALRYPPYSPSKLKWVKRLA